MNVLVLSLHHFSTTAVVKSTSKYSIISVLISLIWAFKCALVAASASRCAGLRTINKCDDHIVSFHLFDKALVC